MFLVNPSETVGPRLGGHLLHGYRATVRTDLQWECLPISRAELSLADRAVEREFPFDGGPFGYGDRQRIHGLDRTLGVLRKFERHFGTLDPWRRDHAHGLPWAAGITGKNTKIEAAEQGLCLVFASAVDNRQFTFPRLSFTGA